MATLGFIGLGVMGSRIVKRLLDARHPVVADGPDGLLAGLRPGKICHTLILTETGHERLGSQVPLDLLVAG